MSRPMTWKKSLGSSERVKINISVVGSGRVGLHTAFLFAEAGFMVVYVDMDKNSFTQRKGNIYSVKPSLNSMTIKHLKKGNIRLAKEARKAAYTSDVIIVNLSIRVDNMKKLNDSRIEKACKEVGMGLCSGSLIIIDGVLPPGYTENTIRRILENSSGLEAGTDFYLAYSPIRIVKERETQGGFTYPRVVGAINKQSLKIARLVLSTITKAM